MATQVDRSIRSLSRFAWIAFVAIFSACQSLDFEARESREVEVALAPGLTVRCETHNGDVRLVRGDAAIVSGMAHVTARGFSDAEARDVLQRSKVISQMIEGRLVLRVEGPALASVDVAFDLRIPEGTPVEVASHNGDVSIERTNAAVKVANHNGRIDLIGVGPMLEIATHNGDVEIEMLALQPACRVDSHNADVKIHLDPSVSATIEASTHNGEIAVQAADGTFASGSPMRRVLGKGEGQIRVATHNGNARIDLRR